MTKRRTAIYAPTRAAVTKALEVAGKLLDDGLQAVTLLAVAKIISKSVDWAEKYLGTPQELSVAAAQMLVDRMCKSIEKIDPDLLPAPKLDALIEILVPVERHRAHAWAVTIAGWEHEFKLAGLIWKTLDRDAGRRFSPRLSVGVIGTLKAPLLPGYEGTRDEQAQAVAQMTRSVEHFQRMLLEGEGQL